MIELLYGVWLSEVAVVLLEDAVLLRDCVVLVQPRSPTVALLIAFEDVGAAVVDSDLDANNVLTKEDLPPAATIAPLFLAALDDTEAIFIAVLLDFESLLVDHEVPDVEGPECLPVLVNETRFVDAILESIQIRRVVLGDCGEDGHGVLGQVIETVVDGHNRVLLDHQVEYLLEQSLVDCILGTRIEVVVKDEA